MDDFIGYLVILGIIAVIVVLLSGMVILCFFLSTFSLAISIIVGFILFNAILFGCIKFGEWCA